VFIISIAKILIVVLFLKIIFVTDFEDIFIPQFFLATFRPFCKFPRHTCEPFASHQCDSALQLKNRWNRVSYPCNRPWRPMRLWDDEAPTFFRQSTRRWRWGCQPHACKAIHKSVEKFSRERSKVADDARRLRLLRLRKKQLYSEWKSWFFYAAGFDALGKRWD
jgi:hypothetical protein